jgi:hypothetical protein
MHVLYCSSQHLEIAEECPIKFMDDIFAIPKKLSPDEETNEGEMRIKKPDCDYCKVIVMIKSQ